MYRTGWNQENDEKQGWQVPELHDRSGMMKHGEPGNLI